MFLTNHDYMRLEKSLMCTCIGYLFLDNLKTEEGTPPPSKGMIEVGNSIGIGVVIGIGIWYLVVGISKTEKRERERERKRKRYIRVKKEGR